jgi:FAD/FMN-containing dehydrogenase
MLTNKLSNARAISSLESRLQGELVWPGDADYHSERAVWNVAVDRRPAVIVRAVDAEDVSAAVDFARGQGLSVAVRGGGHGNAGFGTSAGGLLIDLSRSRTSTSTRLADALGLSPALCGLRWLRRHTATDWRLLRVTPVRSEQVACCSYMSAMGYDEADRSLDAYPPATCARLVALERRYNPTNMFHHNRNVTPD